MSIAEKLYALNQAGVELWLDADRVRYRAKAGVLTPQDRIFLKERKAEIIACLEVGSLGVEPVAEVVDTFGERAAIREYDGGFPRSEAERLAIRDVYDVLPGQDREAMSPEEFQAAVEFFAMLAKSRDDRLKAWGAGRPDRILEPKTNGVSV